MSPFSNFALTLCLLVGSVSNFDAKQAASSSKGTIIDKIVAVVDGHIITLSDIRTEKLMREVLGETAPANDKELLDELIDQHVIDAQLEQYPTIEATEEEIESELRRIKDRKGLSTEFLRTSIRQHTRARKFFEERFGQFVRVTDEQIKKYYEEVFLPAARARGLNPIPDLPAVADDIRRNVATEEIDESVKRWLEQARRAMKIDIVGI